MGGGVNIYLPIAERVVDVPMLLMLGLTVGWLSGMLGIGGGFVITPILTFMGIPTPVAIGTGAAEAVAVGVGELTSVSWVAVAGGTGVPVGSALGLGLGVAVA